MKKSILKIFVMLALTAVVTFSFAATDYWLVDDYGTTISRVPKIEIDDNVNLGKIRIREANQSVGLLSEGDKITITLRNAVFNNPPLIMDPHPGGSNVYGESGIFHLIPLTGYNQPGINSITYELVEKTFEEYNSAYENVDYVINFKDIKPLSYGDVVVEFSGKTFFTSNNLPIITSQTIKIAEIVKKNSLEQNIEKREEIIYQSKPSFTLYEEMLNKNNYVLEGSNLRISFPSTFFTIGQMVGFYSDVNPYDFRVRVYKNRDLTVNNNDYSENIGLDFYELDPVIYNRLRNVETTINEGPHYNGVRMTFNLLAYSGQDFNNLIPIKLIKDSDGGYIKTVLGSGIYDNSTKEYSFLVDGPGIYTIERKETNRISMNISSRNVIVNNIISFLDVPPTLINNSTYVPIRFIAENLGAEVEFLQATNQVEIKTGEKTIYLPIDKVTTELATPARIIEGRTMVPVRYVSEQLGATVTYFADTRKIEIIK